MRHKRLAPSGGPIVKAAGASRVDLAKIARSKASRVVEEKQPFRLPLKQKPNGLWTYRFGKAFRRLKQESLSDYQRDPEDLIIEQYAQA